MVVEIIYLSDVKIIIKQPYLIVALTKDNASCDFILDVARTESPKYTLIPLHLLNTSRVCGCYLLNRHSVLGCYLLNGHSVLGPI